MFSHLNTSGLVISRRSGHSDAKITDYEPVTGGRETQHLRQDRR